MDFLADILGTELVFSTQEGLFSPGHIDRGTLAMLETAQEFFVPGTRVMDLGCGYGPVGIFAAKKVGAENVVMADVDEKAVVTAKKNAERNGVSGVRFFVSDGFDAVDEAGFDLILSNPPYQTDFEVARRFIVKGFNRLVVGGRMVMVTKRLDWYKNKLTSVFGGVKVVEKDGYFVFLAEKRSVRYASSDRKKEKTPPVDQKKKKRRF